jgi:hypothetical protein
MGWAASSPGKRVGTHWIGGSVGPTAGAEDLALTAVRTPNHPASNESLHKLPTLTRSNKIRNNLTSKKRKKTLVRVSNELKNNVE